MLLTPGLFALSCLVHRADKSTQDPPLDSAAGGSDGGEPIDPCRSTGVDINDYVEMDVVGDWPLAFNEIYAAPRPGDSSHVDGGDISGEDWIELLNTATERISLAGVLLDDGDGGSAVDLRPFGSLGPGERLHLRATGVTDAAAGTVGIRLNDAGESLRIGDGGLRYEWVRYPELTDVCSLSRVPEGEQRWEITTPSPGAPNPEG